MLSTYKIPKAHSKNKRKKKKKITQKVVLRKNSDIYGSVTRITSSYYYNNKVFHLKMSLNVPTSLGLGIF